MPRPPGPGPAADPSLVKLQFAEKLLQPGRGAAASSDALQRRLRALHTELKGMEQDRVDLESMKGVPKELISPGLLLHRDTGVKAYVACCLVDVLRLFAPDAPYTSAQLEDIFNFILDQLETNLRAPAGIFSTGSSSGGTKSRKGADAAASTSAAAARIADIPYYNEYLYTLESFAMIKSVMLVADTPKPDDLVIRHFEVYLKLLRPAMNRTFLGYLQEILATLVEDNRDALPGHVFELLEQNVRKFAQHPEHSAFQLVTGVLRSQAEPLQRHLQNHFTELVLQHSRDPLEEDLAALADLYSLLVTLYRHCPDILTGVIPLLEEQIRGDNPHLREQATIALGQMFGALPAANAMGSAAGTQWAMLAGPQRSTWKAWLGRRIDKSVAIRLAWVAGAKDVLVNHQDMREDIEGALRDKLADPEDKVRSAVCRLYGELPYEIALHHVDLHSLQIVAERLQDKRLTVSSDALHSLGRLFNAAYTEIQSNESLAVKQFSWIPEKIMHAAYAGSRELMQAIRQTLSQSILPLPNKAEDEKAWVERLVLVCQYMDARAFQALMACANLTAPGIEPWLLYAEKCEENHKKPSKEAKATVEKLSKVLGSLTADPVKMERSLVTFAEASVPRLYKLQLSLVDVQLDLKTLLKSKVDFLKRLEESQPDISEDLESALMYSTLWIVNRSSIPHLLHRLTGSHKTPGVIAAQQILSFVAKHCPILYATHTAALQLALVSKHVPHSEVALQAIASACKFDSGHLKEDGRLLDKLAGFCAKGSVKQAKYAARLLAYAVSSKGRLSTVIQTALETVETDQTQALLPSLSCLAELARTKSDDFESKAEEVYRAVQEHILEMDRGHPDTEPQQWTPEEHLSHKSRAKILAVKLLVNRCMHVARQPTAAELGSEVVKLLTKCMANQGSFDQDDLDPPDVRPHLRLKAAAGLLKLASHGVYDRAISNEDIEDIALVIQDPQYEVRLRLLQKLRKALGEGRLPGRWTVLPVFSAVDPEASNVQLAKTIILQIVKRMKNEIRIEKVDRPFVRLLAMLAHHPDFEAIDHDSIARIAKYLRFYIELLVNPNNANLLYHLANRMKTVRDARGAEYDDKLYTLSEVALVLINHHVKQHGIVMSIFGGKETLPRDVFAPLPSVQAGQEIRNKSYLSETAKEWLLERPPKSNPGRKLKRVSLSPSSSVAEKKPRTSRKAPKRRPAKKEESSEEESDEEASEDEMMDDEAKENVNVDLVDDRSSKVIGRGGTRQAKRKAIAKTTVRARKRKSPLADRAESNSELSSVGE